MASRALQKARELSVLAAKDEAQCRIFVTHLITLPSFRELETTRFFITYVGRYFPKFEDLQDATVDAVLDLCEDEEEEIRLQGIDGLGKTAKADPRWVRGNAGVLLQLLECPERELKAVKSVLSNLLNLSALSACHVLGVMADDCKGSEEETGASRRNIIRYLHTDCAEFRQKQLNNGTNPAGENIFRVGFLDVLKSAEAAEVRDILDMLLPLPSISGLKAKPDASAAFVRALSDSLKASSTVKESTFHIQQFARLVATTPQLDPQAALYFFERHGGAVVESALYDSEPDACALVKALQAWTAGLQQRWDSKGQSEEEGKGAKALATPLVSDVAHWSKDIKTQADIVPCCAELEYVLLTIYQLCRNRDRRDDILYRKAESFVRLAGIAQESNIRPAEIYRRKLENIGRMAKVLGDHSTPFVDIIPSWLPAPVSRPGLLIAPLGRPASASFVPRATAGQRGVQPAVVPRPSPTSFARPTGPASRQLPPHMAQNGSTPTRGPGLNGTPPSGPNGRPNGLNINGHGTRRTEPIDISDDDEPPSRAAAPRGVPSSSSLPPSGPSSSRGRELLSQASASEDVVMEEPKSTPAKPPLSLAERLSSAPNTKRTREEPPAPTPPSLPSSSSSRSLGSRISSGPGPRPDEPEVKRSRAAEAPLSGGKPPLNARMSGSTSQPGTFPRSRPLVETPHHSTYNDLSSSTPSRTQTPAVETPAPSPITTPISILGLGRMAEVVQRGRGFDAKERDKPGVPDIKPVLQPKAQPAAEAPRARSASSKTADGAYAFRQLAVSGLTPAAARTLVRPNHRRPAVGSALEQEPALLSRLST